MWTYYRSDTLPEGRSPAAWLDRVLPRARESFHHHQVRTQRRLEEKGFDARATFFAADARGPAGIVVISGEGDKRLLDLVAVRGDRRHHGLGKALIARAVEALSEQAVAVLSAPNLSSANLPAVGLLACAGFVGQPTGGIRMRRSLDDPLPAYSEPDGIAIRPLRAGEEPEWVRLKNACFRDDGGREWTEDDFHREFTQSPIFDRSRIFVALEGEQMVGTATAWEANYGEGPVGLIHWVGTRPQCRGKGVGYAVNLRALEELAALGYAEAWLNTARWRVPAVRLYERQGFRIHREAVNYTLALTP